MSVQQSTTPGNNSRTSWSRGLAASMTSGVYDHFLQPVPVVVTHVQYGISYGSTLFRRSITARRADYIALLETAAPAVSAGAMTTFKQVVAAYELPGTNTGSILMPQKDRLEFSRLMQCGTQQVPVDLATAFDLDLFSDTALLKANIQTREVSCVSTFVDEVLTHRLTRRECGKFAMRNLQLMHRVATVAAQQAEGDVAKWLSGVVDWCIRTARSIEGRSACYQDLCCALLLEIGIMRMITGGDVPPSCFLDNHAINVLRQGAVAVFGIGLMSSGLPASQLIFHAARLEFWCSWSFGLDDCMKRHTNVRSMVAESGRFAGLCYGRVYQWAAANWHYGYSFAEWCVLERRQQVAIRTRAEDVSDAQHLGCVARCEHGRSATAGHVGHMPWCRGCTVIHIPEYSGSEILGFDTTKKVLRNLRSGEAYVAVSHVWGQRLFGQDTRSLGQCAISELSRLAAENKVTCVWLDTLCIPSEPMARRVCIDGMRAIYTDAACVAVYDRAIMVADATDRLGFAFEVSISDWNSRVWTLQEGYLNQNVVYVQQWQYIPHRRVHVHAFLKWHAVAAADDMLHHIGAGIYAKMQPHAVFGLAAGRTTSHSVDYVCGLGALLPGPITRAGVDLTTAAVAMARMLGDVDIGVLCTYSPRVKVEGYCWMPLGCQDLHPVTQFGVTGTVLDDDLGLYLEADALHVGELRRIESPSQDLQDIQKFEGGHLHTNGAITFLVPVDADLEGSYDFICASNTEGRTALGFLVAEHDGRHEYATPAFALALQGKKLDFSQCVYVIG